MDKQLCRLPDLKVHILVHTYRYFDLFLLWLVVGTGHMSLMYMYIFIDDEARAIKNIVQTGIFPIVFPLVLALYIVLCFFAGWNWYLVVTG